MRIIKGILMVGGILFFLSAGALGIVIAHDSVIIAEECNKEVREDDRNFCLEHPFLQLKDKGLWLQEENWA